MFQDIPEDQHDIVYSHASKIINELIAKHPPINDFNKDIIYNSVCAAFILLLRKSVQQDDRVNMLQLIYKTIFLNI